MATMYHVTRLDEVERCTTSSCGLREAHFSTEEEAAESVKLRAAELRQHFAQLRAHDGFISNYIAFELEGIEAMARPALFEVSWNGDPSSVYELEGAQAPVIDATGAVTAGWQQLGWYKDAEPAMYPLAAEILEHEGLYAILELATGEQLVFRKETAAL